MPVFPRPELDGLAPCYHGSLSDGEAQALGLGERFASGKIVDFSVNTNPFGPSPRVKAALAEVGVERYPDSEVTVLRRELAKRLGVEIGETIVGNGSIELIWLVCSAYLRSGDTVLILAPTFGEYEAASRIFGANARFLVAREADEFKPDLSEAIALIGETAPRLVFLCNPNNPTGHYLQRREVERVAESARDSLLVIDEAYASLADAPWASDEFIRRPNVIILRSLTKDYALAGLRIGYAVANGEIIAALRRVRPPWSVNAFAQAAALASLRDDQYIERSRLEIGAAKRFLIAGLKEAGLRVVPSQADFVLAKVGDVSWFRRRLLEKGYCVRDCASFGLEEYVRIGVRTQQECRGLVRAIREVQFEIFNQMGSTGKAI